MKQNVKQFDQSVTNWVVATFGTSTRHFFEFMTMLADPIATTLLTVALIGYGVMQHSVKLMLTGAMIPATVIVGSILKMLFERARIDKPFGKGLIKTVRGFGYKIEEDKNEKSDKK